MGEAHRTAPGLGSSRVLRGYGVLIVLALAVRLVFLAYYHDGPYVQSGTLVRHVSIARSLLSGHGFQQEFRFAGEIKREGGEGKILPPHAWPPLDPEAVGTPTPIDSVGYGTLLAGLWRLTGTRSFLPVQGLQLFLDALVAPVLVWIVLALTGAPRRAWAVGGVYALFLPTARMAVNPHREIWAVIGTVFAVALMLRFARGGRWPAVLGAGAVFTLAAWLRPTIMPLALLLPAALLLHPALRPRRVLAGGVALLAVVSAGFWAPFVAYNLATYGEPVAMIQGLGRWTGYGEFPNPYGAGPLDDDARRWVAEQGYDLQFGSLEWDRVLVERVREIEADDPTLKFRNALKRLPQFLAAGFSDVFDFPREYQRHVYLAKPGHTLLTYVLDHPLVAFARFGLAASFWALALLGLALCLPSWRRVALLAVPPAWTVALASYTHFENRNIVIGMWGAIYFVVVGAEWLARTALRVAGRGGQAEPVQTPRSK